MAAYCRGARMTTLKNDMACGNFVDEWSCVLWASLLAPHATWSLVLWFALGQVQCATDYARNELVKEWVWKLRFTPSRTCVKSGRTYTYSNEAGVTYTAWSQSTTATFSTCLCREETMKYAGRRRVKGLYTCVRLPIWWRTVPMNDASLFLRLG